MTQPTSMKPCPFCGYEVDLEDGDTLYPSGFGWVAHAGHGRHYVRYTEAPESQWCWSMNCPTPAGGCGAEITGDSKEETIEKWNRRV